MMFKRVNGNSIQALPRAASVLILLIAGTAAALARGQASTGRPAGPDENRPRTAVLVELFTAEGCSSCPPADALLGGMIASQPAPAVEIVGVGEHVDYWNQLGWRDRFSSAAFTARQQTYADRLEVGPIYTPQMVVDGVVAFVGSDVAAARRAIEQAAAAPHGRLEIDLSQISDRELDVIVTASALPPFDGGDRADLIVAITEDELRTDIKRGENAGKALTHAAVVRSMTTIGQTKASDGTARARLKIASDWKRDRLKVVAFAQAHKSGRVLATSVVAPPLPAAKP
jgi:hypothetical protein